MQDIEVGHPEFDDEFVVKANDQARVCDLLADSDLRSLLMSREGLHLGSDGKMLGYVTDGWVTDIASLTAVHDLFVLALRALQRLGFIR